MCLRGWTFFCYRCSLEMWRYRTDVSETKLWHPLWNNVERLFPCTPVSESLLFSCTSLCPRKGNSAVQVLHFFTWGSHSWQKTNTDLIFCMCLVWGCFIFRGEKATLSFHRIKHFKTSQSDSWHFTVFSKKHIHMHKAEYTILSCHHDQTSYFKSHLGLFCWFGSVVWVYEAPTFPCDQVHCWVSFHKVPTPLWFIWCAESLLWCWLGYSVGNVAYHHRQRPFSNSFQESTVSVRTEPHQSSPKVQETEIFLFELKLETTSLITGY